MQWRSSAGEKVSIQGYKMQRINFIILLVVLPTTYLSAHSTPRYKRYLMPIYEDTFNYIKYFVEPKTGLPYDTNDGREPTSTTNIGLYLASIAVGYETDLIDKSDAFFRIEKALTSLEKIDKWYGFPITWINVKTLKRAYGPQFSTADHIGNLVFSLIVTKAVFPEYRERIDNYIQQMQFEVLYDTTTRWLKGGYNIEKNDFAIKQPWGSWYYNFLAADTRLCSFYGIAIGEIPVEHWRALKRNYETKYGYKYFQPGWQGGGIFMQYLSGIFLDECDTEIGKSAYNFALAQMKHAKKIKSKIWGWSACVAPDGEYLGWGKLKDKVITPHASVLTISYFPRQVVKNLKRFARLKLNKPYIINNKRFKFGFRDSYNIETKQMSDKYLILDQAMIFLSLANYLYDGIVWQLCESDSIIQHGLKLLYQE